MSTTIVSLSPPSEAERESGHFSGVELLAESEDSDPIERIQRADVAALIRRCLDEKERQILYFYYYENLTLKEIGQFLSLSESRVCQIHSRIMERLKAELQPKERELVG